MKTVKYEEAFSRLGIASRKTEPYEGPEHFARRIVKATILKQSDITYSNGSAVILDQLKSQES